MGWDAQGNIVARHDGHLVWEDPRGGRWLALGPRGAIESLQRIDAAGRRLSWKNPNFQGPNIWAETFFELAPAPDGTVWGLFGPELLHLRFDDQAINVIERYPLPEPKWKRIRCDNNGDIWVVFQENQGDDRRPRLYRFATSSKSSGDQR